jgi:2-polyprenyl-6-methoxyphenol hydroxylase-like FAD-dependent oxidoreductase
VTLVGDAGYCPGPAVGGSTSLAVIGSYVLAGELGRAAGDYAGAFRAYEAVMRQPVIDSRGLAKAMAKGILPSSALGVRGLLAAGRLISLLPTPVTSAVARRNDKGIRLYDSIRVPDYPSTVGPRR